VFTIWDTVEPGVVVPAGGTTVRLFGPHRTLRKGRQKLYIWEGRAGDGNVETTTPGKMKNTTEIDRIEKLIKKYDRKQIEHVEWLDRMAFRAIEKINAQTDNEIITKLALFIAFPDLEHPVVFHQKVRCMDPSRLTL
jgi:phosphatidylinositol 3-kinase